MVPHLLVIGAMKCGTTTLHGDLTAHTALEVADKESAGLRRWDVTTARGRQSYLGSWTSKRMRVDVDTTYAMAPHLTDVAARAASVVPEAKVLYVVRDPIERLISHHHHDFSSGQAPADINQAIQRDARFLDYSRYWFQLQHWRTHFPDESILVLRFEDYVSDRSGTLRALTAWLGVPPPPEKADLAAHLNAGHERQASRGVVRRLVRSDLYRHRVRSLAPPALRIRLRNALVPTAPRRPPGPSPDTMASLVEALEPEVTRLSKHCGSAPLWRLDRHLQGDTQ